MADQSRSHHPGLLSGHPRFEGSWFAEHSLSIVLLVVLVVQSVIFWYVRLGEWQADAMAHGESAALWPGYVQHYWGEWLVSVLADTYGALLLVLFTKWFFERGSAENAPSEEDGGGNGGSGGGEEEGQGDRLLADVRLARDDDEARGALRTLTALVDTLVDHGVLARSGAASSSR